MRALPFLCLIPGFSSLLVQPRQPPRYPPRSLPPSIRPASTSQSWEVLAEHNSFHVGKAGATSLSAGYTHALGKTTSAAPVSCTFPGIQQPHSPFWMAPLPAVYTLPA